MVPVGIVLVALEDNSGFVGDGEDGKPRVMMLELAVGTATVVELSDRCRATVIATNQFVVVGGAPDVLGFQGFRTACERVFFADPPARVVIVSGAVQTTGIGHGFAHPSVLTVVGRGRND